MAGAALFPNENYKEWVEAQNDPTIGERSKIVNTINTYFIIKYESWLKETLLDFGFLFDQTDEVAFEDYAYERGLLHLRLTGWRYSNTLLNQYDYEPEFYKISVVKNIAKVIMRPHSTVIFHDDPKSMYEGASANHEFELVSQNGNWILQRVKCYDPAHNLHPHGSDFNKIAADLIERTEADLANEQANALELSKDPRIASRALIRQTGFAPLGYRSFSKYYCRAYALDYALDYNPLFFSYDSDCTNFVSQCIWRGYGGQNSENPIENHDLPMIDDEDAITWWCDSEGTGTWNNKYCWTGVSDFLYMIVKNYSENKVGLQGYRGYMSDVLIGDIVKIRSDSHVYIISNIKDYDHDYTPDWNEIYVSAHTTDREDERLSDLFPSYSYVYFYLNIAFKDPS